MADSFSEDGSVPGVGPFYCPPGQTIYYDLHFANIQLQVVENQFVIPVVMAHELGHHIQELLGLEVCSETPCLDPNLLTSQEIEYMADCWAGAWAQDAELRGRLGSADVDANITQYSIVLGAFTFEASRVELEDTIDTEEPDEEQFAVVYFRVEIAADGVGPFDYSSWNLVDDAGTAYEVDENATNQLLSTAYEAGIEEDLDAGSGHELAMVFDVPADAEGLTLVNEGAGLTVELRDDGDRDHPCPSRRGRGRCTWAHQDRDYRVLVFLRCGSRDCSQGVALVPPDA